MISEISQSQQAKCALFDTRQSTCKIQDKHMSGWTCVCIYSHGWTVWWNQHTRKWRHIAVCISTPDIRTPDETGENTLTIRCHTICHRLYLQCHDTLNRRMLDFWLLLKDHNTAIIWWKTGRGIEVGDEGRTPVPMESHHKNTKLKLYKYFHERFTIQGKNLHFLNSPHLAILFLYILLLLFLILWYNFIGSRISLPLLQVCITPGTKTCI